MIADTQVARALSVLRSGPIFKMPSAVKVGPFSFFGIITDNTTAPADLKLAASRSDSQLDQIAAGNSPGIKLIITAYEMRYDEAPNFATTSDMFLLLRQVQLQVQSAGVTRFISLSAGTCSQQTSPTNGNIGQTISGAPDRAPYLLPVPLVVDLEHDAIFEVAPLVQVNMTANMPFNLLLHGIAFSNALRFEPTECIDDASAVEIGQQGAAMDTVLSTAWNPLAYR